MIDKEKLVYKQDSDGKNAAEHRPESKGSKEVAKQTEKPQEKSSDTSKKDSSSAQK